MLEDAITMLSCVECGAIYKVVRADPPHEAPRQAVRCRCCGAMLDDHDGPHALKYFLVDTPKFKSLRT